MQLYVHSLVFFTALYPPTIDDQYQSSEKKSPNFSLQLRSNEQTIDIWLWEQTNFSSKSGDETMDKRVE